MRVSRYLWLALVLALFSLPIFAGLGRLDLENDEAIHSVCAESLLTSWDWMTPKSTPEDDFVEKPPLKFWLVALPIRLGVLPDNEFGLRFWDATFGGLAFLYVFAIGRRMAGPFCGFVAALVLFAYNPLLLAHGIRTNNMDSPVLLAYCGGVYHYLRWLDPGESRVRWRHALGAGLYFVLGFMSKFVAAAFLPMILLGVTVMLPSGARTLRREWRTWAGVGAITVALIAPWFLYQSIRMGWKFWEIILAEHVFQRFNTWLDTSHLHPWGFYFSELFADFSRAGSFWLAAVGGTLVLARVLRDQWVEGTFVLFWFALPISLISLGTSKLVHYAYPFVPPMALAAGYALAVASELVLAMAFGPRPAWMRRAGEWLGLGVARARLRALAGSLSASGGRWASARKAMPPLRATALVLAALCLLLAIVALVHDGRIKLGGYTIVKRPSVVRSALGAVLLAALAGRAAQAARVAVPVMLLLLAPIRAYEATFPRLMVDAHPLRSARDCLLQVRDQERRAGRQAPDIYAWLPPGVFQHIYYYYYRNAGWDRRDEPTDDDLRIMLEVPEKQRPVLLPDTRFMEFRARYPDAPASRVSRRTIGLVTWLLPGPFSPCGLE
jgi:4-amino-4-deoxy-L-arabinose transferase-like glycosyltransferase